MRVCLSPDLNEAPEGGRGAQRLQRAARPVRGLQRGIATAALTATVALTGCGAPVVAPGPAPAAPASSAAAPRTAGAGVSDVPPTPRVAPPAAPTPASEPVEAARPTTSPRPSAEPTDGSALLPDQVPPVIGTTSQFARGTPDATLRAAFACAAADDFACYAALNVRSNRDSEMAIAHLKNYQWRLFRERWQGYVIRKEPFSLHITRRVIEPGRIPRIKLFLFSDGRDNPAPCIFELQDGAWRIYANSL